MTNNTVECVYCGQMTYIDRSLRDYFGDVLCYACNHRG